jgi:superfamily II DNA/RNA helicase
VATFAHELAGRIRSHDAFWADLAILRSTGIRASIPSLADAKLVDGNETVSSDTLTRLLSSASAFSEAEDDESRDLAQQIAVFSTLASEEPAVREASVRVLAALGNFPGLAQLESAYPSTAGLQTFLQRNLLASINRVDVAGNAYTLTDFQSKVWQDLKSGQSLAISAPTSAGKSFLVLEHLCLSALAANSYFAIYIAPTRALLSEVHSKVERRLHEQRGDLRVTTIPSVDPLKRARQIFVLTQERVQLLLPALHSDQHVDLVVVDEAQSIADDGRGMILQDCLEKLREQHRPDRFVFLAPGVSGLSLMGDSLGIHDVADEPTVLSPVVQNRISVSFSSAKEKQLTLSLLQGSRREPIATLEFGRGFALKPGPTRVAAVALELGRGGRSLVYATGAAKAEGLAEVLASNKHEVDDTHLRELSKFVESYIHKDYSLAQFVKRGVGFHYGNMPSLLRQGIESAFREGRLEYLVCTTTLFQGVNLPARNVFIDTPKRGNKGELLDDAALWNFAGRAGRLGEEVVGNVFLVDYDNWEHRALDVRKPFALKVALSSTLENEMSTVLTILRSSAGDAPTEAVISDRARSAAGLILMRASQGTLEVLLRRTQVSVSSEDQDALSYEAKRALNFLKLPPNILLTNWVVDPIGLSRLLGRFRELIASNKLKGVIPINPSGDGYDVYKDVVRRMYKYIGGMTFTGKENAKSNGFANLMAVLALRWMRGQPLSLMISDRVNYETKQKTGATQTATGPSRLVDRSVRATFELVENELCFKLVQWGRAYVDLLRVALIEAGREREAAEVYDFALALELGISSTTGRSLIELGLSRITASVVSDAIADSSFDVAQVRSWFATRPPALERLAPLLRTELLERGLLPLK